MREIREEVGKKTPKKEMTSKVVQIGLRPLGVSFQKTNEIFMLYW